MLTELHIENFAIIDRLDLVFDKGLITFTGETGAGKSIIIDAVECLLGGRAESSMIRSGIERASIEGVFSLPASNQPALLEILEREDLLDDPAFVTLGREIRANGRSTARINGRSISTSLLREVSELLVDVHGQSEHLSLLRVSQHLGLLDNVTVLLDKASRTNGAGSFSETQANYRIGYQRLQQIKRELETIQQAERDAARRADLLSYQIHEIEGAHLQDGEEDDLKEERNRLANAEGLASLTQEALVGLDDGSPEAPALTDVFGQVLHALTGLARLDPSQSGLSEQAELLAEGFSDLARNLRNYQEGIEFNPRRLDQVEERLGLIHSLKRKYGDSILAVLEYAQEAQRQLDEITHAEERQQELLAERQKLLVDIGSLGSILSQKRQNAAAHLQQAMESELADLNMNGARFRVDFQQQPDPEGVKLPDGETVTYYPNGLERVEFLIAPNPGEGFKPLAKIASGGETSRLMLALKNVLAQADQIPTLVFDEIDQGIGGRIGAVVGHKLWSLGKQHQVLCITHLPQLAAYGEQHFNVQKHVQDGRTTTQVQLLKGEKRLVELAQMMGEVSEGTLHSAREMMSMVSQQKAS